MTSKDPDRERRVNKVREVKQSVKERERQEKVLKARELKANGYNNAHIAKVMEVSESTVRRWLKEES